MRKITAIIAIGTWLAAACKGVGPFEPDDVEMFLTADDPVLTAIGATTTFRVRFGDGVVPATSGSIVWRSSAPSVATVDRNGIVTAVSDGVATITAEWGGLSASTTTTVAATIGNVARARSDQSDSNPGNDIATVTITVRAN
jgi:hypothetical protein